MTKLFTKDGDEYKEVENLTQEQIDDLVGSTDWLTKRLERERNKFSDYDDLKAKADSVETVKSEFEKKLEEANKKATDLETEVSKTKLEVNRVKIVSEFKLPDDLAEFVTGDTEDELRTRAEKLAKGVKPSGINIDKTDKPDKKTTGSAEIASKLFGKKSDD